MPEDTSIHLGIPLGEDKAWAEFKSPLNKNIVVSFCQDVERLLRINPYLIIENWEKLSDEKFQIHAKNQSQTPAFKVDTDITVLNMDSAIELHYSQGLKSKTLITINEENEGSRIKIIEEYEAVPKPERLQRQHEIDKSLIKWAEDIQTYLLHWQRWSWFPLWRFYKQRVWLPMKPSARRITYILLCISLVEFTLIALGSAIYVLEYK